jgi:hypothetical protein
MSNREQQEALSLYAGVRIKSLTEHHLIFNNNVTWLKYLLLEQGKKLPDCFGLGNKDDGIFMHIYEFRGRKFVLAAIENVLGFTLENGNFKESRLWDVKVWHCSKCYYAWLGFELNNHSSGIITLQCCNCGAYWQSDNIKGVLDSLRRDDPKMPEGVT